MTAPIKIVLDRDHTDGVWIQVGPVHVRVYPTDEGAVVDCFGSNTDGSARLDDTGVVATTYAYFSEAEPDENEPGSGAATTGGGAR